MKQRLAGLLLWAMLALFALAAIVATPLRILFGNIDCARESLRAWDQMANAGLFGGFARESLSSHAWRAREAWWARLVILVTEPIEPDHCRGANLREQPVVDFIASRKQGSQ